MDNNATDNGLNFTAMIKQYESAELCAKWHNNIPLSEIQGDKYILLTDSQEVTALYETFKFLPAGIATDTDGNDYTYHDVTAAIVAIGDGDGDYNEVYVTESARPYDLTAVYHPLSYYLD